MKPEMDAMDTNQVWTLVDPPEGIKPIGCKWVFKRKTNADGKVQTFKARLVAKGYKKRQGIDFEETFSPVAMLKSIRILLAIAAYHDYEIWQMDVKTAFLIGNLQEEVYMTQPEGNDIPLLQSTKIWLSKQFSMKDLGEATYILGIKIYRDGSKRLLGFSQSTYIDKVLKRFSMMESKKGHLPMSQGIYLSKDTCPKNQEEKDLMDKIPYALTIGSIMYAMLCTKPYVSYALSVTSRYQANLDVVPNIVDPIPLYCDNNGAIAQAKEPRSHQKSKHVLWRYHVIREIIGRENICIKRIPTEDNIADPLTKALSQQKHNRHVENIGIRYIDDWL
ncbi:Reverse transcriptase [Theobroma cacao]|nr:Reverse transcriptase [Theobroma cacao]